jgi:hypothetical protein
VGSITGPSHVRIRFQLISIAFHTMRPRYVDIDRGLNGALGISRKDRPVPSGRRFCPEHSVRLKRSGLDITTVANC